MTRSQNKAHTLMMRLGGYPKIDGLPDKLLALCNDWRRRKVVGCKIGTPDLNLTSSDEKLWKIVLFKEKESSFLLFAVLICLYKMLLFRNAVQTVVRCGLFLLEWARNGMAWADSLWSFLSSENPSCDPQKSSADTTSTCTISSWMGMRAPLIRPSHPSSVLLPSRLVPVLFFLVCCLLFSFIHL